MATIASISAFKANLQGGGARPNQFAVNLSFPTGVLSGFSALAPLKGQFMVHAASLPESKIDPTNVPYRGRDVYLAGERKFIPWTISIYNDTDFTIRNAFESWMEYMNRNQDNTGETNPSNYQTDMSVDQYDRNNLVVKSYKFIDAFPIEVSPIALNFADNNIIESYNVTIAYQYWTSNTTKGGLGLGVGISTPVGNFPIL